MKFIVNNGSSKDDFRSDLTCGPSFEKACINKLPLLTQFPIDVDLKFPLLTFDLKIPTCDSICHSWENDLTNSKMKDNSLDKVKIHKIDCTTWQHLIKHINFIMNMSTLILKVSLILQFIVNLLVTPWQSTTDFQSSNFCALKSNDKDVINVHLTSRKFSVCSSWPTALKCDLIFRWATGAAF